MAKNHKRELAKNSRDLKEFQDLKDQNNKIECELKYANKFNYVLIFIIVLMGCMLFYKSM